MALLKLPTRPDVAVIKRKSLTKRQRAELFLEHKGICGLCGKKIDDPIRWRDEHLNSLFGGGDNSWRNRAPVHLACAKVKDKTDAKLRAKIKRLRGDTGTKRIRKAIPSRPMAGTVASGLKKSFSGKVTKR